ncbi:hypothetical protein CEP88_05220 [Roseobacter denitrificans]|nr:hypothetical protein CEP88_05220 [Roseobacter denitrificans]
MRRHGGTLAEGTSRTHRCAPALGIKTTGAVASWSESADILKLLPARFCGRLALLAGVTPRE